MLRSAICVVLRVRLVALLGLIAACAPEPLDTAPPSGGTVSCSILCDYSRSDGITVIRAVTESGGEATCESCRQLLEYHASQFSCEDGAGRHIVVEPLTECAP